MQEDKEQTIVEEVKDKLMLAGVTLDMYGQEKRITIVSVASALIAYVIFLNDGNKVVWTIFISVVASTLDFLFLQKRRVDMSTLVEEGRESAEMSNEWRFWKKEYWSDFKLIKPTFNVKVLMGALSIMMLNIGANISFGGITAGVVASNPENKGILDIKSARAISKLVGLCDSFSIPVLTLVDSEGLEVSAEAEANAYGDYTTDSEIMPTYLRLPQAERERLEKLQQESK